MLSDKDLDPDYRRKADRVSFISLLVTLCIVWLSYIIAKDYKKELIENNVNIQRIEIEEPRQNRDVAGRYQQLDPKRLGRGNGWGSW